MIQSASSETVTFTRTHKACAASSPTTNSPPAAILTPAIHWNIDIYDLSHLQPSNSFGVFLHRTRNSTGSSYWIFTKVPAEFRIPFVLRYLKIFKLTHLPEHIPVANVNVPVAIYPVVNIDHSNFASILCLPNNASVQFSNPTAYQLASNFWLSQPNGLILITNDPGCSDSAGGEHAYLLVQHMVANDPSMVINGGISYLNFTDAVGHVNSVVVSFGQMALSTSPAVVSITTLTLTSILPGSLVPTTIVTTLISLCHTSTLHVAIRHSSHHVSKEKRTLNPAFHEQWNEVKKKVKNIQQRGFASGHPPNY
jgi:hypothetical protein